MPKKAGTHSRRGFLKISAAGAAGAVISGIGAKKAGASPLLVAQSGWTEDRMPINPEIDNLRVVSVLDPEMAADDPIDWSTMERQNEHVVTEKVYENMDKMAIALADREVIDPNDFETNAREAWATIFHKPENKEWADVNVAIKLCAVEYRDCPRLAIIAKVCLALGDLGVQMSNIKLFEHIGINSGQAGIEDKYNDVYSQSQLPEGVVLENNLGNNDMDVEMPNGETTSCVKDLADGTTDILVNISCNKGHYPDWGNYTAAVKNHIGSLTFSHPEERGTSWPGRLPSSECAQVLVEMNKSLPILGGDPVRQQLCIVDSLWVIKNSNTGVPDAAVYGLMMGTFAPAVDYALGKELREDTNVIDPPPKPAVWSVFEFFLREFGYDITDGPDREELLEKLQSVDALTFEPRVVSTDKRPSFRKPFGAGTVIITTNAMSRPASVSFTLDGGMEEAQLGIFSIRGKQVRSLALFRNAKERRIILWNGMDDNGRKVRPGAYIVKLRVGRQEMSRRIVLSG
jgi:hypothetical protein